jgi:hypothetical protein
MLDATSARNNFVNNSTVETEIGLLNLYILSAISNGLVSCTVHHTTTTLVYNQLVTGTAITSDNDYYRVWQNTLTNNAYSYQMTQIIDYYHKLGYTISRKSTDGQLITWVISW